MIRSFEGARGLAALLVALFHLHLALFVPFIAQGYLFVDLFFVLSGYLICSIYTERLTQPDQFAPFIVRRFGRLFPLLIASTIVYLLVVNGVAFVKNEAVARGLTKFSSGITAVPYTVPTLAELSATVTMTHALGLFDRLILNSVSWSISVEFYTYLLFAAMCLLAPARFRMAVFGMLAIAAYTVTVIASVVRHDCFAAGHCMDVTYDFGFARCVAAFFLGALTWHASRGLGDVDERTRSRLQWIALAALVLIFSLVERMPALTFACPLVFALLVFSLERDTGPLGTLLQRPVFQLLGERSYSIYMVHPILLMVLEPVRKKLHQLPGGDALLLVAYVCIAIWIAGYSYRWIEAPWRGYFNRIADRLTPRRAADAAPRSQVRRRV